MRIPRSFEAAGWVALVCLAASLLPAPAASRDSLLAKPDAWFRSDEGRAATTNILSWQAPAGGWPKNVDTSQPLKGDRSELKGTFDNGATTGELRFLARAFTVTGDGRCRTAVLDTIDLILKAQYPTGGWPQSYPPPAKTYHRHITFNDGSMVRVMETLRSVATGPEFAFVDAPRRAAAQKAFDRGIDCILKCQIKVNGQLTVWCAQHDEIDFSPRPARAYELASLSGAESAGILRLLMSLGRPSSEVRTAIEGGSRWFASARLTGQRVVREDNDVKVVADPAASPIWARFYNLETGKPMFVDRDGKPKATLAEIGAERRTGYAWYGNWGAQVAKDYQAWQARQSTQPHR